MLSTARYRCDIVAKGAVLPGHNDTEMGPTNWLHASAYYSEYNERSDFDLIEKKLQYCTNKSHNFISLIDSVKFSYHIGFYSLDLTVSLVEIEAVY